MEGEQSNKGVVSLETVWQRAGQQGSHSMKQWWVGGKEQVVSLETTWWRVSGAIRELLLNEAIVGGGQRTSYFIGNDVVVSR